MAFISARMTRRKCCAFG